MKTLVRGLMLTVALLQVVPASAHNAQADAQRLTNSDATVDAIIDAAEIVAHETASEEGRKQTINRISELSKNLSLSDRSRLIDEVLLALPNFKQGADDHSNNRAKLATGAAIVALSLIIAFRAKSRSSSQLAVGAATVAGVYASLSSTNASAISKRSEANIARLRSAMVDLRTQTLLEARAAALK